VARERRTRDELDAKTAQVGISEVTYPVQSVDRALLLLREFLVRPRSRCQRRATRSASLGPQPIDCSQCCSTTASSSRTVVARPTWAERHCLRSGSRSSNRLDIRGAAQPSLQALVASTQETAHLVVLQALNVLYLDGFETPRALRAGLRIGATLPANCTLRARRSSRRCRESNCVRFEPGADSRS